MVKKQFTSMGKSENLKGGINLLIKGNEDQGNEEHKPVQVKEKKKETNRNIRSYYLLEEDIEFISKYARYMAFKKNEKYTLQRALHDALNLLRKKHPELVETTG